ncbi:MAG: 16S rRNA (guanine(527)-N(7))-methyltransferase RsmG [Bacteroidales bacterium]
MEPSRLINKYFPWLTTQQQQQLLELQGLYADWNSKINVISRKDMDNFFIHHVLHSLSIARIIQFRPHTRIMDVGTGGGFPGIPLAIAFPDCQFLLVDSIGKKIKVVEAVAQSLGLQNVQAQKMRAEEVNERFDFVVSRAVTTLPAFMQWVRGKIHPRGVNALPNGVLYLKGGDVEAELRELDLRHTTYELNPLFEEPFFETKKIVHLFSGTTKKNPSKEKSGNFGL